MLGAHVLNNVFDFKRPLVTILAGVFFERDIIFKQIALPIIFATTSLHDDFTIRSVSPNTPAGLNVFTKHVDVLSFVWWVCTSLSIHLGDAVDAA